MRKLFFLILTVFFLGELRSQTLYSNSFGNLTLSTYSNNTISCQYTTAPNTFTIINDAYGNNAGTNFNPNTPFFIPSLKYAGWVVAYSPFVNDTFLVSTSWLDDPSLNCSRWVVTPSVNVSANTVLTWLAMSPDANHPDGYEVYGTEKTSSLTADSFKIGDLLYSIPDGNTSGGGEKKVWTRRSVDLSLFAGKNLKFGFKNNSRNMFQLWIDDIEVKNLSFSRDLSPVEFKSSKYFLTNTAQTVSFALTSLGAASVQVVSLSYQWGNSTPATQSFTLSNRLCYLQEVNLSFPLQYTVSSAGSYPLKVWINSVDGSPDQNLSNDTLKTWITVMNSSPQRNVMLEQFMSAFDGDAVDAQEKAWAMQSGSIIVVNVHDSDSLREAGSASLISLYKRTSTTGLVNRMNFNDSVVFPRTTFVKHISDALNSVTAASVNISAKTINTVTGQVDFTVAAGFAGDVKGDYRINAYLVENHVYGPVNDTTVNGYNQFNNYYFVPWSPYYLKGYYSSQYGHYVLDAKKFLHQDVLIHSFDGSFGNPGTIPQNGGTASQTYTQAFTWSIPTLTTGVHKYIADNIHLVAFVAEYGSDIKHREILNVTKEKLTANPEVVGLRENSPEMSFRLFPNPGNGKFYLRLDGKKNAELGIYDIGGVNVETLQLKGEGLNELDLSFLPEGIYILQLKSDEGIKSEKLIIHR